VSVSLLLPACRLLLLQYVDGRLTSDEAREIAVHVADDAAAADAESVSHAEMDGSH